MSTKNGLLACLLIALLQSILLQGASQEEGWVYLQRMQSGQASQDDIDRAIEQMRQGRVSTPLMRSLGQYGGKAIDALPYLQEFLELDDREWYLRANALRAIGNFGPLARSSVPKAIEIMRKDGNDAWAAITTLGEIQDESTILPLLEFLVAGKNHSERAAEALARFPTAILAEYVDVRKSVNANIEEVMRKRISTRDDFHLSMVVRYTGMITLDGLNYTVNYPEYFTQRRDIFYFIKTPDMETFRLNVVQEPEDYWADMKLGTIDSPSISAIGNSPQRPWAQESVPDFEQEGVYRIHLEGRFQDRNGIEPPLEFATNTVSFEISSRFLSREEERQRADEETQKADEEFNRQFPLGPVHVLGSVNRPGRIGLRAEMRLSDAIAEAGGLMRSANFRRISLARIRGEETEVEAINFSTILEGEHEDPLLRKNDVIFVPTSCIVEGSEVLTPAGPIAIEDLKEGDVVIAYNTDTYEFSESRITGVFSQEAREYLIFNQQLKVTPDHIIYSSGNWIRAEDVSVGMDLLDLHGEKVPVTEILMESEAVRVYDISVEAPNTLFANGILVHNKF